MKKILFLGILTLFLVWVGGIWGVSGALIALVVSIPLNIFLYNRKAKRRQRKRDWEE